MTVHLYGVVSADTSVPSTVRGRQDAAPRLVSHGALAAIVTDVDPDKPVGRADLLAHAHVLEAFAEDATVLPMRFGTIVDHDDEVVEHVLRAGEERLTTLLHDLRGLQQLTIEAAHDEKAVLLDLLAERPDIRALRQESGAGADLYEGKLGLGRLVLEGVGAIERRDAAMILDALSPLAREIVVEEPARQGQVLLAALLVRRDDRPAVDAAVAELKQSLPDRLRIRYVGPQPPYAFVDAALAGEPIWA